MPYDPLIPDDCINDGLLIGSLFIQHLLSDEDITHMISYDYSTNRIYGNIQKGEYVVQIDLGMLYSTIIIANITGKSMIAFTRNEISMESENMVWKWEEARDGYLPIDISNVIHGNICIEDLNWFGGLLFDLPFGYGILTDNNEKVIYEGFIFEGECVCWGKQFDPKTKISVYEGGWYRNSYCGYGTRKSSTGQTTRKGIWLNGEVSKGRKKRIVRPSQLSPRCIQEGISREEDENVQLVPSHQEQKDIVIPDNLLERKGENSEIVFTTEMITNLKTSSLLKTTNTLMNVSKNNVKAKVKANQTEEGYPLPFLHSYIEELIVHSHVDSPWASNRITFHWLINLRLIEIADHCYKHISSLSFYGLSSLKSLSIGENSFSSMNYYDVPFTSNLASIIHCPCLRTIHIKKYAMNNYGRLVLKDLPSLESIQIGEYSFGKGFSADFRSRSK